jgi:hypothetical protein
MSKVAIAGDPLGTGTFTIQSPNSNTDRTLVLPDEAGTVLTSASDLAAANLTGNVAAARITHALNASGSAPIYACRAWVNFNGTTSPGTIRASGNVSSVTRNGTGDYTVNFTTAMPDADYSPVSTSGTGSTPLGSISSSLTTTSFRYYTYGTSAGNMSASTARNNDLNFIAIFR